MEDKLQPMQKRWLSPKELEYEYGFSVSNQAQMRMKKIIPHTKVGGYVRYDRLKIDQWLENNTVLLSVH
jgi:hypothetical protein